jgi:predicted molibdopterin-dependent oxidoreductase YjgC
MEFNYRAYAFPEGVSVLRAAELNGIYIPSLCSHKDLSPFGGCRLCMVEIEGMRGYPLACDTVAQEGMKVLTDTARLRELRQEILKLILSEHPSSCLICTEKEGCKSYQVTIRKVGVTTGCRFCPSDGQCELQAVVEKLGVTDVDYPIYYRGFEAEQEDPFYDRDYNLCILCGRCVRMCQEVRGTGVLAFTYRGPRVKIGPAFGRNHVEAGCEFCGACVDVCPTGTLADKVSKWDGKPDGFHVSTCPFCGVGCQLELYHKNGSLSRAKANLDPEVNDGQLCVRGRFCLPEVTHHFERVRSPMLRKGEFFREVSWDEALEAVAGKLHGIRPEDFLMLVSPDLTNESLFAAQKFVRACLGCNSIDSTARLHLAGGLGLWSQLFALPISITDLARADAILAVGLDSRFDFSVVGVQVRRALDRGAKLVTMDPRDSNLAGYTDHWLRPLPGAEGLLLSAVAEAISGGQPDLRAVARKASVDPSALEQAVAVLASGEDLAVILGPQVFHYGSGKALVDGLSVLSARGRTTFMPLYFGANARGALEMGVFPELLPGGAPGNGPGLGLRDLLAGKVRPKVIYLVGEVPCFERPDCDVLIVQDTYLPPFEVDVFLPAASSVEAEGTLTNVEGRVQALIQVERLPEGAVTGYVRPDWRIFSDLAASLNSQAIQYRSAQEVLEDIHRALPGFPASADRQPRRLSAITHLPMEEWAEAASGDGRFRLVAEPAGFRSRGVDIASKVGGLAELALEEGFRMNPEDLHALGLNDGDTLTLSWNEGSVSVSGAARSRAECPRGVIYFTRPVAFGGLAQRRAWGPLYNLQQNPVAVNVGVGPRHIPDRAVIPSGG